MSLSINRQLAYFITTILFLFNNYALAKPIAHSMTVSTSIDKSAFFNGDISIKFKDEILYPEINKDTDEIMPVMTQVYVEATLLNDSSSKQVNHAITLTRNVSQCYKFNEQGIKTGIDDITDNDRKEFTTVYLDGIILKDNMPLVLHFQNKNTDENFSSLYEFKLKFGKIPNEAISCSGDIQLMVGFDL
ncbi:hypothetical protein FKQ60_09345 [Vibrio sp. A11]|uniref:hypothetical protein n=1 Tax=Vibrio sp. A11 TaxID=2591464 RepID=UPI001483B68A|nr:hypothetical protein [Vibrio sp. A11]NNN61054.1 hypothetical protein [Vibrio sp. A11]